jgi:glycosyltransferase involved in cell wall biosynthesis
MMRLAIDGKRLVQARTGPARWLEHLLHQWRSMDVPFTEMRVYTPGPTEHSWEAPPKLRNVVLESRLPMLLWENLALRRAAAADDVLFGASYTIPLAFPRPSVVSNQGIYEGPHGTVLPWWHKYRYSAMFRHSAQKAAVVLANSQSTKNDLVQYYGIDPAKIRIVYQGVGPPFGWRHDREAVARQAGAILGFTEPYFLFVGKMSVRRHVPELLRAFAAVRSSLPDATRLVLVGPDHVQIGIANHIAACGLAGVSLHLPHLDQERLATVYSGATAFILPTTHEGLSATILEAMACGTPVVTVDHAPLAEGFREHVLLLEAPDVASLRDAMLRLAQDASLRDRLSEAGRGVAARFSWRRTAEETMNVLADLAQR